MTATTGKVIKPRKGHLKLASLKLRPDQERAIHAHARQPFDFRLPRVALVASGAFRDTIWNEAAHGTGAAKYTECQLAAAYRLLAEINILAVKPGASLLARQYPRGYVRGPFFKTFEKLTNDLLYYVPCDYARDISKIPDALRRARFHTGRRDMLHMYYSVSMLDGIWAISECVAYDRLVFPTGRELPNNWQLVCKALYERGAVDRRSVQQIALACSAATRAGNALYGWNEMMMSQFGKDVLIPMLEERGYRRVPAAKVI